MPACACDWSIFEQPTIGVATILEKSLKLPGDGLPITLHNRSDEASPLVLFVFFTRPPSTLDLSRRSSAKYEYSVLRHSPGTVRKATESPCKVKLRRCRSAKALLQPARTNADRRKGQLAGRRA